LSRRELPFSDPQTVLKPPWTKFRLLWRIFKVSFVQLLLLPYKVFLCVNCWVMKKNFSWLRLRENSSRNY
jgi:hypothetical protein